MHFVTFYILLLFHLEHVFFKFMHFKTFILNTYKKTITYKGLIDLKKDFKTVKNNFYNIKIISSYIKEPHSITLQNETATENMHIHIKQSSYFSTVRTASKTKRICHCLPHSS